MYKKNVGLIDRLIRVIAAELIFMFSFFWAGGRAQIILYVLSLAVLMTAIFSFCGLYKIFGLNTNKHNPHSKNTQKIIFIFIVIFLLIAVGLGHYWNVASKDFFRNLI